MTGENIGRGDGLDESDESLIGRTQQGDQQAFAELVRRYQAVSFRVAYVVTGSAEDAEDATQEAFIRAYRAIGRFRPGGSFRPWLLTIVANAARTRRRAGRMFSIGLLDIDVESAAGDARCWPEAAAIADEQVRELLTGINTLRDDDRQVIVLRYFLELSEAEMSTVLNCARGTVKSRLSRALARLRTVMFDSLQAAPDDRG